MYRLWWSLTLIGTAIGGITFIVGMAGAKGAPQEAAASAMALCFALLPYAWARAWDELARPRPAAGPSAAPPAA